MLQQWNKLSRPGLGCRMTTHAQEGVEASKGDESSS